MQNKQGNWHNYYVKLGAMASPRAHCLKCILSCSLGKSLIVKRDHTQPNKCKGNSRFDLYL